MCWTFVSTLTSGSAFGSTFCSALGSSFCSALGSTLTFCSAFGLPFFFVAEVAAALGETETKL